MELKEVVCGRRSVRNYEEHEISDETLQSIIRMAQMAPSWKNTQTVRYIAVKSAERKAEILSALPEFNRRSAKNASVIAVMITRHGLSGFERDGSYTTSAKDGWEYFDAGIACQTLCLAAWDSGVATCIMGIYDEAKMRELLKIPENERITAVIPMGYAAEVPAMPQRKSLEEKLIVL